MQTAAAGVMDDVEVVEVLVPCSLVLVLLFARSAGVCPRASVVPCMRSRAIRSVYEKRCGGFCRATVS